MEMEMTETITTVGRLINGDSVLIEGEIAVISEIVFHKEPLVTLKVETERFGRMSILTADDMPVTVINMERGE